MKTLLLYRGNWPYVRTHHHSLTLNRATLAAGEHVLGVCHDRR